MMSGVRSPGTRLGADGKPDPTQSEPYAQEAHYFTESRLLQVGCQLQPWLVQLRLRILRPVFRMRIRIDFVWLDPDLWEQKRPTKIEKNNEISSLKVLDVLFWGLKAFPVAWMLRIHMHHLNANPDPDPAFHFNADPAPR